MDEYNSDVEHDINGFGCDNHAIASVALKGWDDMYFINGSTPDHEITKVWREFDDVVKYMKTHRAETKRHVRSITRQHDSLGACWLLSEMKWSEL